MRTGIVVVIATLTPMVAQAAPETYSCSHTSKPFFTELASVDQVILDRDAKTIDLRDASTMGTSRELQWVFRDEKSPIDQLTWEVGYETDLAFGVRGGVAFIFMRTDHKVGLTMATDMPPTYDEWVCLR